MSHGARTIESWCILPLRCTQAKGAFVYFTHIIEACHKLERVMAHVQWVIVQATLTLHASKRCASVYHTYEGVMSQIWNLNESWHTYEWVSMQATGCTLAKRCPWVFHTCNWVMVQSTWVMVQSSRVMVQSTWVMVQSSRVMVQSTCVMVQSSRVMVQSTWVMVQATLAP